MKSRTRTANYSLAGTGGPTAFWGSGMGLLLLAIALFLFVIVLWLFIDQREDSIYPVPRVDRTDLREAPR